MHNFLSENRKKRVVDRLSLVGAIDNVRQDCRREFVDACMDFNTRWDTSVNSLKDNLKNHLIENNDLLDRFKIEMNQKLKENNSEYGLAIMRLRNDINDSESEINKNISAAKKTLNNAFQILKEDNSRQSEQYEYFSRTSDALMCRLGVLESFERRQKMDNDLMGTRLTKLDESKIEIEKMANEGRIKQTYAGEKRKNDFIVEEDRSKKRRIVMPSFQQVAGLAVGTAAAFINLA